MTGLPQIGNWGADVGNAFANLGQGLSKIRNPHQEIQMELKKRIAANPEIAQQLFDQEIANPGSISAMYGKQVADWLKGRTQSFESKVKDDTRTAYETDPAMKADVIQRSATGQTTSGRQTERDNATITGARASVAPKAARNEALQLDTDLQYIALDAANKSKVLEGQANQAELSNKNIDTVLKNWTKAEGVDFQSLARKVGRNQTLTSQEQATLQIIDNPASPHKETWAKLLSGVQQSDQLSEQQTYHRFVMNKENNDLMGKVIGEWKRLKSPGGSAVYLKDYMFDPKVSAQAMQLEQDIASGKRNPNTLSKDEAAYLAIQRSINQDEGMQRMMMDTKLGVQSRLLRDQYIKARDKGEDDALPAITSEMTNNLMQRAQNAGQQLNIRVGVDDGGKWFDGRSEGDLKYTVTMPDGTDRILDKEGIEKLFETFQPKPEPIGTGEPETGAYKHGKKTTSVQSESGTMPELAPWKALSATERTKELHRMYPKPADFEKAKAMLVRAGMEVY